MTKPTASWYLLLLVVVFIVTPARLFAAERLMVTAGVDSYPLGGSRLDILEDATGNLTIADITAPRHAGEFRPSRREIPNFGLSQSAFWFRFTIAAPGREKEQWLLYLDQPLMDEVDLYLPTGKGNYEVRRSGDTRPDRVKELPGRSILLPLTLTQTPSSYYLRTWTPGRAIFPLTVLTSDAYRQREAADSLANGCYIGFMLALALVALSLFLLLRERAYLWYLLYLLSLAPTSLLLEGYLPILVSPAYPWVHHTVRMLPLIFTMLTEIAFTRSFLNTRINAPRLDLLLRGAIAFNLLSLILLPVLSPLLCKSALNFMFLATSCAGIAAAVIGYRRGFAAAGYFIGSRCAIYLGATAFSLLNMGLVPVNFFTQHLFQFASCLDVGFIMLALNYNYREINRRNTALVHDLQVEAAERRTVNQNLEVQIALGDKLRQKVVRISDDERRHISRVLHDGLCQKLAGARLYCSMVKNNQTGDRRERALAALETLLQETVDEAYDLSHELWPIEHDPQGKSPHLSELVQRLAAQSGVAIDYMQQGDLERVSAPLLTQLYRIAQEAIINAIKHSGGDLITVSLREEQGKIVLSVADNGHGILPECPPPTHPENSGQTPSGGLGMRIMRHRAAMINGDLTIGAGADGGVMVTCRVEM